MSSKSIVIAIPKPSTRLRQALKLARLPIVISFFLTPTRFLLEVAGLPENSIFIIGLLWLTLGFCVYWGIKLSGVKHSYQIMLLALSIFAPISRVPVALFWWIDTHWEIGTHYGWYFTSWPQALLNHVVYGALVQIIPGMLIGSLTLMLMQLRKAKAINKTL